MENAVFQAAGDPHRIFIYQYQGDAMARILVIDDEPMIVGLIREVLSKYGETVQTASNGEDGLKMLEDSSYDIIMTDMCMPDLDGESVIRFIRNSNHATTPVIGISGTPWLLKKADCNAVLSKPFQLKDLVETVNRLK
jgi:CheY-like chemotaxis protein